MNRLRRHSGKFYSIIFLAGFAAGFGHSPRFDWGSFVMVLIIGYLTGEALTWCRDLLNAIFRRRR